MGTHLENRLSSFNLSSSQPEWAWIWHARKVFFPRRSISGKLVRGTVLRRFDGRKWMYKKLVRGTD